MKTVAFLTLGCKLNYAETSTYERGLVRAGFRVVSWREKADVYVVNTCSVTATSDAKSRNLVRKVNRINPSALIAVVGCSAQLRRSELEALEGVWRVFGSDEKGLLVAALTSACAGCPVPPGQALPLRGPLPLEPRAASLPEQDIPSTAAAAPMPSFVVNKAASAAAPSEASDASDRGAGEAESSRIPLQGSAVRPGVEEFGAAPAAVFGAFSTGERTRSFLKVQDGCNNFCAYCTVPYARGGARSVPLEECVAMAREIAAQGVKEIVLTGVNTGSYGSDTGVPFLDLLRELNSVQGIERYRISSIEPNLITPEIIDWIASGTKFQPHFHIPLQSGCDDILSAMGRRYTTEFFRNRIEYIRRAMEGPGRPRVFFGIDLMVGLPGETQARFEQSYSFIRDLRPAFIHVFPYSRRPGTPAAEMPDQVPEEVKAERVARIEELCSRLHGEFVRSNAGVHAQVLFESSVRGGMMEGYTGNYIRVERPYDAALVNTLVDVVL